MDDTIMGERGLVLGWLLTTMHVGYLMGMTLGIDVCMEWMGTKIRSFQASYVDSLVHVCAYVLGKNIVIPLTLSIT
jgi:hypothetical protein